MKPKAVLITGVTASGKTELVHQLYRDADILINADTGQFYKKLNIATAKPTLEEIGRYHYELINFLEPGENFSAYCFLQQALSLLNKQRSKTRRAFIIGGPSLYIQSLFCGLPPCLSELVKENSSKGYPTGQRVAQILEQEYYERGLAALLLELKEKDNDYYRVVDKRNHRRIIRALTVIRETELSYTDYRKLQRTPNLDLLVLIIALSRRELYQRIEVRVEEMFQDGLIDETKNLLRQGYSSPELFGIGYSECIDFLEGRTSLTECKEAIITHTKQFAKRQINWLKSFDRGIFLTRYPEDRSNEEYF